MCNGTKQLWTFRSRFCVSFVQIIQWSFAWYIWMGQTMNINMVNWLWQGRIDFQTLFPSIVCSLCCHCQRSQQCARLNFPLIWFSIDSICFRSHRSFLSQSIVGFLWRCKSKDKQCFDCQDSTEWLMKCSVLFGDSVSVVFASRSSFRWNRRETIQLWQWFFSD